MNKDFEKRPLTHWALQPLEEAPPGVKFPWQMPEDGSGSSLSPHLAELQMLFIFITVSSPLTNATEFLGSIKIVCHRVPWVKCTLLSEAFPFVCVSDETFGDLQPLSASQSQPPFLCPAGAKCPSPGSTVSSKVLTRSTQLYTLLSLGDSQRFPEAGGMFMVSTQSAERWEQREEAMHTVLLFPALGLHPKG